MQASPRPAGCWGGEKGQKEREGDQGRGTPWAAGTILELPAERLGSDGLGEGFEGRALCAHTDSIL